MRLFLTAVLFFGGAILAALPAVAGHLDCQPLDLGCWMITTAGLLGGIRAAIDKRPE